MSQGKSISLFRTVRGSGVEPEDACWLAGQWDGPFVIKGLQSPAYAKRALEIGATAIMVSSRGGRQLEGAPAPIDCIAPIRDAIANELELILDGGIRRGTHIIKAMALGADACSMGRPYLYGLAAAGQAGVERTLEILKDEVERSMALLGGMLHKGVGAATSILTKGGKS